MGKTLIRTLATRFHRLKDLIPQRWRLELLVGFRVTVDREP
jgi:hypothetical protein